MTDANAIEVDHLITLVEQRPVLWDKTSEEYKNKNIKTTAWTEVCENLFPGFQELNNQEKTKFESRPPRKDYNQLSSSEKLDNRQPDDIHIEETEMDSDASSTDLDERDTRGVCPPCARDRYNNNIRRHTHDDFSDDTDYDEALTCNVCDRSFSTRRQLSDHQQKKRHFGCSACDSLFPSLMSLEHHKEEFQHWSESSCCEPSDSERSDSERADTERLL